MMKDYTSMLSSVIMITMDCVCAIWNVCEDADGQNKTRLLGVLGVCVECQSSLIC